MKVLAIDTSFEACSAAIVDDGDVAWAETRMIGRGHSEVLPVMVAEGLRAAGISVRDLDRIGVVIGPGAFAGVRVGLAFARGLCLGTGVRAVGVTSLRALAASCEPHEFIAPIFDARRGQVYAALYDRSLRELIEPFVASPEAAAKRLSDETASALTLAGSGAALVAPHLGATFALSATTTIDPAALARLAAASPEPTSPPAPLYLRPPDAAPSSGSLFGGALTA
jgi:tRNA threonylcarbamoyladenosine biosynthesis protein TsaB